MNSRGESRYDPVLLLVLVGMVCFGLVMVYSASFPVASVYEESQGFYLWRQLRWAILGGIGMYLASRYDYRQLRRYSVPLMGLTLLLLVLVLVLPESVTVSNGAARWIRVGPFGLQPSEVAKMAGIIYFADWLSQRGGKIRTLAALANFAVVLGLLAGLVLLEPDMGTTIVIVLIGALVLFTSGASLLHLASAATIALSAGWMAIHSASYRLARLNAFRNPWEYYDGPGYQPIHSLYALASGGVTGVGLGESRQKFLWLPFAHTDAIMSVVGEELGLLGTLLVLIGFVTIGVRGYRIATRITDPFGALLAVGITSWLCFQALLNMAVISTLVPFTGVPMPFLSYGGSSLTMTMVAAGVLLNLSRAAAPQRELREDHAHGSFSLAFRQLASGLAGLPAALRRGDGGPRLSSPRSRSGPARRRDTSYTGSYSVGHAVSGTWRQRLKGGGSTRRSGVRSQPIDNAGGRVRGQRRRNGGADRRS